MMGCCMSSYKIRITMLASTALNWFCFCSCFSEFTPARGMKIILLFSSLEFVAGISQEGASVACLLRNRESSLPQLNLIIKLQVVFYL